MTGRLLYSINFLFAFTFDCYLSVEHGLVEPQGVSHHAINVRRIHCAQRLSRDLWIDIAGAALAVEILDEIEQLRSRCVA